MATCTPAPAASSPSAAPVTQSAFPGNGIVLLSLNDGSVRGSGLVGSDPVAVIVSDDGATAYLADSSPGDVYAVKLPDITVVWKQHVGGAPFGLLLHRGHLFVSLFSGAAVIELDPVSGVQLASHPVPQSPAALAVAPDGRVIVAGTRGAIDYLDGTSTPAGHGFGVAVVGDQVWTADYEQAELVRIGDGLRVGLPLPVFPFWLASSGPNTLLIAAEGAPEDSAPGGVFSYTPASGTFKTLARPRDPDQALRSGSKVLVAAHGDRQVLAIDGGRIDHWAPGAAAVAIASDPALNLLVVVVNVVE